jgi:hypothetical protein
MEDAARANAYRCARQNLPYEKLYQDSLTSVNSDAPELWSKASNFPNGQPKRNYASIDSASPSGRDSAIANPHTTGLAWCRCAWQGDYRHGDRFAGEKTIKCCMQTHGTFELDVEGFP